MVIIWLLKLTSKLRNSFLPIAAEQDGRESSSLALTGASNFSDLANNPTDGARVASESKALQSDKIQPGTREGGTPRALVVLGGLISIAFFVLMAIGLLSKLMRL
jgi:hypothetical protein